MLQLRSLILVVLLGTASVNGFGQKLIGDSSEAEHKFTDWAGRNAIQLKTTVPGDDFSDMVPLGDVVGDARIVELGEATHGTSEFFQMKDRMVRYLATQKGFTIFSIEANMPEAYRLNDYVLNGVGDPKALLKGMYFWTWNTQEVLDMILWMRQYNLSGKSRLQFTGFDMQTPTLSLEEVHRFVAKYDPTYVLELDQAYKEVGKNSARALGGVIDRDEIEENKELQLCREVFDDMSARRSEYSKAGASAHEIEWAIQNARLLVQYQELKVRGSVRDRSMAENIEWIANQNPGAKIIVWAHNGHVSYQEYSMGGYLKKYFGPQIVNFGFIFDQGSFRASDAEKHQLVNFTVGPAPNGTWESALAATGIPLFALNLRSAAFDPETVAWMSVPHRTHSLGAIYDASNANNYWYESQLQNEFDAIFFVEKTTASHGLP